MLDYSDELGEISQLLAEQPHGMTITSIAAESGIGRNRVAKYLDVLSLSGRTGMKQIGNAKVFFLINRIPVTSMLNLSSDFIIVVNNRREVAYVSDNLLETEQLRRQEVIGTDISHLGISLLPFPDLADYILQAIGGREMMTEYAVPGNEGPQWFRAKIIPTAFEGGVKGAGIMLEDITDLKAYQAQLEERIHADGIRLATTTDDLNREIEGHGEALKALKKSERRYHALVDHAREGILALDPNDGIITFVNPTMATMLGYAIGEMQGRSAFTFTDDAGTRMLREAQARLTENGDHEGEIKLFRRDGTMVYAEITSTPMHTPGDNDRRWLLLINDVTDKKKKEAALKFTNTLLNGIIEGSDRMVAAIDTNFAFITSNSAYKNEFERVFGRPPEAGMRIEEILSHLPDDLEKAQTLWARALEGEDFRVVERFGEENEYEIRFFPLRDNEGTIFGAVNLLYDITSLEKAVRVFQEQDIELRKLLGQSEVSSIQTQTMDSARP
ncbi:PAS domain S-box protein [Methanogenium sp. S4BF]|uniref:PAS domain-containing protein n=1 Tax=Methanogenium sp. S4BF TaxID=1789226 RepID=UPI0024168554|nr:PAS domain S-box protein [Methanogenium sp. S4BF]WFN33798.1 PAS domain S-box protein [Methanogenium sp. S4BF]